jgi:glycosyltransferase involved in cell wall biosynthesis
MRYDPSGKLISTVAGHSTAPRTALKRIALVGNALPRRCGLATFTSHVREALRATFPEIAIDHYAMVDPGSTYCFPESVTRMIAQEERASYHAAARVIEQSGADLIWVQHEFGIYGGPAGSYLLDLLDSTTAPLVVTLHTVLDSPNDEQRSVMEQLAKRASLFIVMVSEAAKIVCRSYDIPASKILVIPHGVPDRPLIEPQVARQRLGFEDRPTVLTFGLLSPGKGIETMIRAMPSILDQCPSALYSIVGATHPHLVAEEGEAHRARLQSLADELQVAHALRWDNRFLCENALLERIAAADVYVTPYRNPNQITSGTLAYALGLGKPIVSTPYVHAVELLAAGRGVLVPFDDVDSIANAVGTLLINDTARHRLAALAYEHGRSMTWRRMAEASLAAFDSLLREPSPLQMPTYERSPELRTGKPDHMAAARPAA